MAKAEPLERREVQRMALPAAVSWDPEARQAVVIASTDAPQADGVALIHTREAIRWPTRPLPVFVNHEAHPREFVGSVVALELGREKGAAALIATVQLADSEAGRMAEPMVASGAARWSVRARVHRLDPGPGGSDYDRATDWEPVELSLVGVGMDAAAVTRSAESTQSTNLMEDPIMTATPTKTEAPEATVTRAALREAQSLERSISAAGLDDAGADEVRGIAEAQGVAAARKLILDKMAQREAQAPTRAHVGAESSGGNREQLIERTVARLQGRDDITVNELLRATTGRSGRTDELLRSSQSTSDLAQLVGAAGQRYAMQMYGALEPGSSAIVRRRQVPYLRDVQLLRISEFPGLEELTEGGEVRYGALGETGGSYVIREFAKALRLTRRALLSDDLGLLELAMASGARAAGQLEDQLVRALLEGGAGGLGGICGEDGKALFHSSHNNVATNTGLSIEALTEALALLRGQTVPGAGAPLNLRPRHLLVPASHEVPARQLVAAVQPVSLDGVNPFGAGADLALQVHVDPLLSAAYLAVDPSDPAAAIELATGPAALQVDSQPEFETTSLAMRVLADRGAGIRDFRGIARIALA